MLHDLVLDLPEGHHVSGGGHVDLAVGLLVDHHLSKALVVSKAAANALGLGLLNHIELVITWSFLVFLSVIGVLVLVVNNKLLTDLVLTDGLTSGISLFLSGLIQFILKLLHPELQAVDLLLLPLGLCDAEGAVALALLAGDLGQTLEEIV